MALQFFPKEYFKQLPYVVVDLYDRASAEYIAMYLIRSLVRAVQLAYVMPLGLRTKNKRIIAGFRFD